MSSVMSARVGVEGDVTEDEVLVIGELHKCDVAVHRFLRLKRLVLRATDTEGSLIPSKFKSAAQVTLSSYSSTGKYAASLLMMLHN